MNDCNSKKQQKTSFKVWKSCFFTQKLYSYTTCSVFCFLRREDRIAIWKSEHISITFFVLILIICIIPVGFKIISHSKTALSHVTRRNGHPSV